MGALDRKSVRIPLCISAFAIMLACGLSFYAWTTLPEDARVPTHWGINGRVDGYSGKAVGLSIMPGLMIVIALLFPALTFIEPRGGNLRQSLKPFAAIWIAMMVFLLLVHALIVFASLGRSVNVSMAISAGVGCLFCVIGNYLGKVRSNFFVGVRTPWTLSSETSWNKSNRLAGKLFVIGGGVIIVSALFLSPQATMAVTLVTALGSALVSVVYSYLVWKSDPARKSTL